MRLFLPILLLALAFSPAAVASDPAPALTFKSEPARAPDRAALVQTCSAADERKGLCRRRFVIPDPYVIGPHATAEDYNARGSAFLQEGWLDRAIEDFGEAIRLKPDYAEAFNSRGCAYLAKHQYERALADFDAAIRVNPGLALAFFNRAETRKAMRDYRRALLDYDVYVRLEPKDVDGFVHRAFAQRQLGAYDAALADLDEAARLKPKDPAVLNARCWTRAVAGVDLTAALKDCDESLRLRPQSCETLDSRALVYFRLGRLENAIADNTAALKINPKLASSFYVRGLARARRGESGADADIAAALALEPGIAAAYEGYGISR